MCFIYFIYNIAKLGDIISTETEEMKDSIYIYSLTKGLGELFWNSCPVCGCVSIRTIAWEDGSVEYGECKTCNRMSELMELEELFAKASR